ncbi:hypothetical protein PVK06_016424 [Gossypium arboreum]|uniref:Uncharacterized protein n=1 Tax=Gossypium arboreum TaxID=29729 RepID=A0ABR0Q0R5_GOSAR|nr:hypothetical protein PVK06_016424 [Gossypium arboreum]
MDEKPGVLMFCLLLGILVSSPRQDVTALVPIRLKYTFCLTTCVSNRTSLKDCIQYCLASEALVETLEETHLMSSFGFCIVGCKGSCRLRQYLRREMRHEELMIIAYG